MDNIDLLIVDDDAEYRSTVRRRLSRRGYRVQEADDSETALELAARRQFQVAVIDLVMPGLSGLDTLEKLKAGTPDCEAVMLTGQGTIETAVDAMKRGAFDFLTKPFPLSELEVVVQKAFEQRQLRQENRQLKAVLRRSQPSSEILGKSDAIKEVLRLIERAGPTDKAILIQGESGTGKELVARALHRASKRADKPFPGCVPKTRLVSLEMGEQQASYGLLTLAHRGTLSTAS